MFKRNTYHLEVDRGLAVVGQGVVLDKVSRRTGEGTQTVHMGQFR